MNTLTKSNLLNKVSVRTNEHLVIASWQHDVEGSQILKLRSVDLKKYITINRDYSCSENDQLERVLNQLQLNFLGNTSNYTMNNTNYCMFTWDMDTLRNNFNKETLDV